jgi:high affinity cAMP-specific and IBMX-insensitive 3',5'-cyclic phosphodiesterase 8
MLLFPCQDEIIGRPLSDLISIDGNTIISQTSRHREYDGNISIRRKSQDVMSVHYKVIPVSCVGRSPTHLVITMDTGNPSGSDILPTIPQAKEAPRGSLHSIRRGSFDVRSIASDGLRRTSLAKLSSLPLEAPITKVLTILAQVQEGCSFEEAKLIDRVMEFLKREGLYSPQMKEIRTDDPVANDLIGALLTVSQTGTDDCYFPHLNS